MAKKTSNELGFKLTVNTLINEYKEQDKLAAFRSTPENQITIIVTKDGERVHINGLNLLPKRLLEKIVPMMRKYESGNFV